MQAVCRVCWVYMSIVTRTLSTGRTMSLKFAANLNMLFQDTPTLTERYKVAQNAGFKYVECTFPYNEPLEQLAAAKRESGLEHVLINAHPGDMEKGDLGLAALPDRKAEFREKLELSIQYANALDCKRMHVMAGLKPASGDVTGMEETFLDNLRYAADRLQKEGILALIEPVNNRISLPRYFMPEPSQAMSYLKKLNHPNLKLQFDFFHFQIMVGNLTSYVKEYFPFIGHIQIAQVPDRGEPDLNGEISYRYIFSLLEQLSYDGYIGLEYKPRGKTEAGLRWLKDLGYLERKYP